MRAIRNAMGVGLSTFSIRDVATIVRSKNAGPFRLTLDVVFKDDETYRRIRDSGVITRETIASLYSLPPAGVTNFVWFDPARALKATLMRRVSSGAVGDTDIYGAQQHVPLLELELPASLATGATAAD